jgi:hypothetical protein
MTGDVQSLPRRPLWVEIGLTAVLVAALLGFGAACVVIGDALGAGARATSFFVVLAFVVIVAFLVCYAFPRARRRWYHFAISELCVLSGFLLPVPLVALSWLIVTRREWRPA